MDRFFLNLRHMIDQLTDEEVTNLHAYTYDRVQTNMRRKAAPRIGELNDQEQQFCREKQFVNAIKSFRDRTGEPIGMCKAIVDAYREVYREGM